MSNKFYKIIFLLILLVNSACANYLYMESADYKVDFKVIKEDNKKLKYTINTSYPVISGFHDKNVQDKFNSYAFHIVFDAVNSFKNDMKTWEAPKDFSSEFEIADSVWFRSDEVISIRFDGYEYYAGAAHPLTFFYSAVYDLKNNKPVKLSDMFTGNYLKAISDYCIADLVKQKNEYTDNPDISWIQDGASPKDSNYTVFNITGNSLLITFPVYQVASYAEGPKEVYVPYSVLQDVIDPKGPLSIFIKK